MLCDTVVLYIWTCYTFQKYSKMATVNKLMVPKHRVLNSHWCTSKIIDSLHFCFHYCSTFFSVVAWSDNNMLWKSKRHSLRCHDFLVHAYLLHMCTNVVDFRVMWRLCRHEWNWQRNWQSVNQHSWDPWQWTMWSRCVTSDFNSVL